MASQAKSEHNPKCLPNLKKKKNWKVKINIWKNKEKDKTT